MFARQLQQGGPEAVAIIEALADFPFPEVAQRIIQKYHNRQIGIPAFTVEPSRNLLELTICANYAFVKRAKE